MDDTIENSEGFSSDEDRIINNIIVEGNGRLFDDTDFLPIRQSLYTNVSDIPEYDGDTFHRVVWCRPVSLTELPEYFVSNNYQQIGCIQGTLPDEVFIGALMGVAAYNGRDLLENIIASKPHDFKTYGIYTCRFYVEGEWVEVITDTNLPCLRDENTGEISLAYTHSIHSKEMWIPFIEKAYAKAVGSYEAIQKVRVHEALLHLTGGSVQQVFFHDAVNKEFSSSGATFKYLNRLSQNDTLILLVPFDKRAKDITNGLDQSDVNFISKLESETNNEESNNEMFYSNRIYSVITCRNIGGYELVLLHNPWGNKKVWTGSWSDDSNDWDLYPEILHEIEKDVTVPWKRFKSNGYFWMTGKMVHKFFNICYSCKLFPSDKFSFYCVKGEWKEKTAGGSVSLVRDKADILKDAQASNILAQHKAIPAVVIDGELSWFNNPQYRLQVVKPSVIYISILPTSGSEDSKTHTMVVTLTSMPIDSKMASQKHLWESTLVETVATVKPDTNPRVKGQEASIWKVEIDHSKIYHIIAHTQRPGLEGAFIVRIFSSEPIVVEKVSNLEIKSTHGGWTKAGDTDTTGGPLAIKKDSSAVSKQNPKWCQNPQYHLEMTNPFSKEEVYLKVVLRRFDREAKNRGELNLELKKNPSDKLKTTKQLMSSTTPGSNSNADKEVNLGMIICRAECLEEAKAEALRRKRQPRENIFGEIMVTKESTLKRLDSIGDLNKTASNDSILLPPSTANAAGAVLKEDIKTILRKVSMDKESFFVETTCSSKNETTVFFPKLPRSWMPHGVIIVPFLSEKNIKANFELDIYCSETFKLTHVPDAYSRCLAGEWKEGSAGGSHLLPTWKKNPKYNLKVRNSSYGAATNVRISLYRFGTKWRANCKKDTVGCMIGFYVFRNKSGELTQIYESNFVPVDENITEPSLQLGTLASDEVYTVMPTTFGEGKFGPFVLSIMSERDFTVKLEK